MACFMPPKSKTGIRTTSPILRKIFSGISACDLCCQGLYLSLPMAKAASCLLFQMEHLTNLTRLFFRTNIKLCCGKGTPAVNNLCRWPDTRCHIHWALYRGSCTIQALSSAFLALAAIDTIGDNLSGTSLRAMFCKPYFNSRVPLEFFLSLLSDIFPYNGNRYSLPALVPILLRARLIQPFSCCNLTTPPQPDLCPRRCVNSDGYWSFLADKFPRYQSRSRP